MKSFDFNTIPLRYALMFILGIDGNYAVNEEGLLTDLDY